MSIRTFNDLKVPWFHARGTRVYDVKNEWKNTQFVTVLEPSEYRAGDNFLMQCAANFKTDAGWRDYFRKAGGFGVTARGEISFGDAFAKLLKAHRMKIDSAKGAPSGITFAGYNNAIGSIKSGGNGAIILGTYIVGRLALSLSKEWVSVQVGYYDIPCLGTGNEVVSCRVRETDFSIRRPHRKDVGVVESDEDIIIKFLKFGLSLSDLSFPNICELIISCGQPVNGSLSLDKINGALSEALKKKNPYANPNIMYSFRNGNSIARTSFLLRSLPDDFTARLRECKYQPSYFGKTGNAYWGDYLVCRSMQTPFQYGKTVEETVMNCIDYCRQNHWGNYVAGKPVEEPVVTPVQSTVAPMPQPVMASEPPSKVEDNPLKDVDFSAMDWEDDEETAAESGEFAESDEEILGMFDEPAYNEKEAKKDFARMWRERRAELKALYDLDEKEDKAAKARGEDYDTRNSASQARYAVRKSKMDNFKDAILAHPVWQNYKPEITKDGRYRWGLDAIRMTQPREFAEVFGATPGYDSCIWGVSDDAVAWGYTLKTPAELMQMSYEEFEKEKTRVFDYDKARTREYLLKCFGITEEVNFRVSPDSVMGALQERWDADSEARTAKRLKKARKDFKELFAAKMSERRPHLENEEILWIESAAQDLMNTTLWKLHKPKKTEGGKYIYSLDVVYEQEPVELAKALLRRHGSMQTFEVEDDKFVWGKVMEAEEYFFSTPDPLFVTDESLGEYMTRLTASTEANDREFLKEVFGIEIKHPKFRSYPKSVWTAYMAWPELKKTVPERLAGMREAEARERAERETRERVERERLEAEAKSNEYFEDFADDLRRRLTEAIKNNRRAVFEVDENDEDNWYNPYAYMGYVLVLGLQMVFGLKDVYERGRVTSVDYYYGEGFFRESAHKVRKMYEDVQHVIAQSFLDLDTKRLTAKGKEQVCAWRDEYDEFAYGLEKAIENHFDRLKHGDREGNFKHTYYRLVNDAVDSVKSNLGYLDDLDLRA